MTPLPAPSLPDRLRAPRRKEEPMSEPDEAAVEAVAEVLAQNRNPFPLYPPTVMGLDRDEARLMLATPVVAEAFRDAERLLNLAARFEGHDDWDRSFLGEQIAVMLRGDGT